MQTHFRFKYKIVGESSTAAGSEVTTLDMQGYLERVRRNYPDAGMIYVECLGTFESKGSGSAEESLIILGMRKMFEDALYEHVYGKP